MRRDIAFNASGPMMGWRRRTGLVLIGVLACGTPAFSQSGPGGDSPEQLAAEFFRCRDAECAVRLFHFPTEYSAEDLRKDSGGVRAVLDLFERELGRPAEANPVEDPEPFIEVGIGGADAAYWEKHPDTSMLRYAVKFEKEGAGIIAIEACHIGPKWRIRSVHYGLPANRVDAKPRIDALYTKMMALP